MHTFSCRHLEKAMVIKKDLSAVCGFEAPCLIHIFNSCFFTVAFPSWLFQDVGMKMDISEHIYDFWYTVFGSCRQGAPIFMPTSWKSHGGKAIVKKHEFKICMRQGASNPHTVLKSFLIYLLCPHVFTILWKIHAIYEDKKMMKSVVLSIKRAACLTTYICS